MTEPDVTLTDYGVTLECAVLTALLFRPGPARREVRRPFALLFASSGAAALAGGTVHGFFPRGDSGVGAVLWRIVLLTIGLTSLAGWSIGGRLLFAERPARVVEGLAVAEWLGYAAVILAIDQSFWIAIANYAPSVFFVALCFVVGYRRHGEGPLLAGLVGLLLMVAGALVQRLRIGLHPAYFNHNSLFHVVQMAAFLLVFLAGRHVIVAPAPAEG